MRQRRRWSRPDPTCLEAEHVRGYAHGMLTLHHRVRRDERPWSTIPSIVAADVSGLARSAPESGGPGSRDRGVAMAEWKACWGAVYGGPARLVAFEGAEFARIGFQPLEAVFGAVGLAVVAIARTLSA